MKRFFSSILAILLLLCSCGCGNKDVVYSDEDVFVLFADAVGSGDFSKAYTYLSSGVRGEGDRRITEQAFIDKYTAIYDALGVKGVSFTVKNETVVGAVKSIDYTVSYDTQIAGALSFDGTASVSVDGLDWRVDWSPSLIFPDLDWDGRVLVTGISARRGDILASGGVLAQTVDYDSVYINTAEAEDIELAISSVSAALGMSPDDVRAKVDKAYGDIAVVAQYMPDELDVSVKEALGAVDGVGISNSYGRGRLYPHGSLMAHTIGYVGHATEEEVAAYNEGRSELDGLYTTDSMVGKSGLEKAYERVLRGRDGYSVTIRDAEGRLVSTLYRRPAEDGQDVMLTIDFELQRRAEEVLDLVLWGDDTAGAVVVMDPTTGAVEALASYPTYDLNLFAGGISDADYQAILNQANAPLYNRTTQGLYPPGSAFKVFTATGAMETGTLGADYVFTGDIVDDYWTPTGYGTWIWPAIKRAYVFNRETPLNMANALLHSDNIYFANAALLMGEQRFTDYMNGLGMSSALPFELSVARSQLNNEGTQMNSKLLADSGYGQGEVLITPLQLATMYCAFRNGGDIPTPFITRAYYRTIDTDYSPAQTFDEKVWIEDAIEEYSINIITPMLERVTSPQYNGTGRALRARGCDVAGKTGTAEIGSDKSREISWFVGFRINISPDEERLVLVVLEIPTDDEYSGLKFDIARELLSME